VHWNGETFPGLHQPLVDDDTFDKAQTILRRRHEDASLRRGNPTDFLLSGLVRCDRCGRAYVARLERKLDRYFEAFEEGELSATLCQERAHAHRERLEALREQEAELVRRLATRAHTPPDTAALTALADQLEDIIATESPEQA
jgi:hypothetical protein